jgi:putative ABC transport system substrate-binding protein
VNVRRATLAFALALAIVATALAVAAQPAAKAPRIGLLLLTTPEQDVSQRAVAFRDGLRDLGWVEDQNILLEYQYAGGERDRLVPLARELVQQKVDVIVAFGTEATRAARRVTPRIPIVMASVGDPVGAGLVRSLARPGGNVTGTSLLTTELGGKRLELLREAVPRIARVAVVTGPTPGPMFRQAEAAASRLGIELHRLVLRAPGDLEALFAQMSRVRVDGFVLQPSPMIDELWARIAPLAVRQRLPSIAQLRGYAETGGLMSYGASLFDQQRRAAAFVDKILKGASPADLPVEEPTTFELVVNMKTARTLGLSVPSSVLIRADHVFE